MGKVNIKKIIVGFVATGLMAMGLGAPVVAGDFVGGLNQGITDAGSGQGMSNETNVNVLVNNIINIILYVAGVLAVGFLVFGGIKYVTSAGDSSKVKSAKDTILYAVIGLAVTVLAYAIVNFVITDVFK